MLPLTPDKPIKHIYIQPFFFILYTKTKNYPKCEFF